MALDTLSVPTCRGADQKVFYLKERELILFCILTARHLKLFISGPEHIVCLSTVVEKLRYLPRGI